MAIKNKSENCIDGVIFLPLKIISDERGAVLHMLRVNSPLYEQFGEIYFSEIKPKTIKAWKLHTKMNQHITVPYGAIKLVIYDSRDDSLSKGKVCSYLLSRKNNFYLIKIPPKVWYGFQCVGNKTSLVANCTDLPHYPDEAIKIEPNSEKIPYKWEVNE